MATISAQITLYHVIDILEVRRYYLLQSSTLTKPVKPTTYPPSINWGLTEPSYTEGSTNSLYFVDCTIFSDESFKYSEVSLSSSYEAAKAAYNKANAVETRVINAETRIDQNENAIELRATKTEVTTAINNLDIGGRNYVKGLANGSWTRNGITVDRYENEYHIYGTNTKTDEVYSIYDGWLNEVGLLEPGVTYTLSLTSPIPNGLYVQLNTRTTTDSKQTMFMYIGGYSNSNQTNTETYPSDYDGLAFGFFGIRPTCETIDVTFKIKLEKGNKATDWTPAPEDMATKAEAETAQDAADNALASCDSLETRVTTSESTIQQLADSISMLITDENGSSLMTQTSTGWTFNIGGIADTLSQTANGLTDVSGDIDGINSAITNLNGLLNDIADKTAYIIMTTDDNGDPCIELGKENNDFKVRITNTSVDFLQGSSPIAWINNNSLYIEKAIVRNELQIGESPGFVWKTRSNNNMGLRWIGG